MTVQGSEISFSIQSGCLNNLFHGCLFPILRLPLPPTQQARESGSGNDVCGPSPIYFRLVSSLAIVFFLELSSYFSFRILIPGVLF